MKPITSCFESTAECLLELHSSARLTCVTVWQSSNDENEHEEEKKAEESVQMLEESKIINLVYCQS